MILENLDALVKHVYMQLLEREPSASDIEADRSFLKSRPQNLKKQILNYYFQKCTDHQGEYKSKVLNRNGAFNQLNFIYNTLLQREVDEAGQRAYLAKIEAGVWKGFARQ